METEKNISVKIKEKEMKRKTFDVTSVNTKQSITPKRGSYAAPTEREDSEKGTPTSTIQLSIGKSFKGKFIEEISTARSSYAEELQQLEKKLQEFIEPQEDEFLRAINGLYKNLGNFGSEAAKKIIEIISLIQPPSMLLGDVKGYLKYANRLGTTSENQQSKLEIDAPIFHQLNIAIEQIKVLINELEKSEKKHENKYQTTLLHLKSIQKIYEDFRLDFSTTSLSKRIELITGKPVITLFNVGMRYLKKEIAETIYPFDVKGDVKASTININEQGSHLVRNYQGLHFKYDPTAIGDAPGFEFAVATLDKKLSNSDTSTASTLVKIGWYGSQHIVKVSPTVHGKSLTKMFNEAVITAPLFLTQLNPNNFNQTIIKGFWSGQQDGKSDNFMVPQNNLTNIDEDQVFVDPFVVQENKYKKEKLHFMNVRYIPFLFPQMNTIQFNAPNLLNTSPALILMEWLEALLIQNMHWKQLKKTHLLTKKEYRYKNEYGDEFVLPVRFVPGTITNLYQTLKILKQKSLGIKETLWKIFETLEPEVAHIYKICLKKAEEKVDAQIKAQEAKSAEIISKITSLLLSRLTKQADKEVIQNIIKEVLACLDIGIMRLEQSTNMQFLEKILGEVLAGLNLDKKPEITAIHKKLIEVLTALNAEQLLLPHREVTIIREAYSLLPKPLEELLTPDDEIWTHVKANAKGIWDFQKERTQTIEEAFQELLGVIDFKEMNLPAQKNILTILERWFYCTEFRLHGCAAVTDEMLEELAQTAARYGLLTSLSLTECEKISEEGLKVFAQHYSNVEIRVSQTTRVAPIKWPVELAKKFKKFTLVLNDGFEITTENDGDLHQKKDLSHKAAQLNSVHALKFLLAQGFDIAFKDEQGKTILHHALENNSKEVVSFLLQLEASLLKSIDINAKDNKGKTALHYAVETQNKEAVEPLIQQPEISIDCEDNQGYMPFHRAIEHSGIAFSETSIPTENHSASDSIEAQEEKTEIVNLLLKKGASANKLAAGKISTLQLAAQSGSVSVFRIVLKELKKTTSVKELFEMTDSHGQTLLHFAAKNPDSDLLKECFKELVCTGMINVRDMFGATPLFRAASYGRIDNVNLLLSKNADAQIATETDTTPLDIAKQYQYKNIMDLLNPKTKSLEEATSTLTLSSSSSSSIGSFTQMSTDAKGNNILQQFAIEGDLDHLEEWMNETDPKKNKDPKKYDNKIAEIKILLNMQNKYGETFLHLLAKGPACLPDGHRYKTYQPSTDDLHAKEMSQAPKSPKEIKKIENRYKAIITWALEHCANVDAKDDDERTPLFNAVDMSRSKALIKFLIEKKASLTCKDKWSNHLLHKAVGSRLNLFKITKLLIKKGVRDQINQSNNLSMYIVHDLVLKAISEDKVVSEEALKTLEYLAKEKAQLNCINQAQETPLMLAAKNGNLKIVKFLLNANKNTERPDLLLNMRDMLGNSALHIVLLAAFPSKNKDLIQTLINEGANVEAINAEGKTPRQLILANPELQYAIDLPQQKEPVKIDTKILQVKLRDYKTDFDAFIYCYQFLNNYAINAEEKIHFKELHTRYSEIYEYLFSVQTRKNFELLPEKFLLADLKWAEIVCNTAMKKLADLSAKIQNFDKDDPVQCIDYAKLENEYEYWQVYLMFAQLVRMMAYQQSEIAPKILDLRSIYEQKQEIVALQAQIQLQEKLEKAALKAPFSYQHRNLKRQLVHLYDLFQTPQVVQYCEKESMFGFKSGWENSIKEQLNKIERGEEPTADLEQQLSAMEMQLRPLLDKTIEEVKASDLKLATHEGYNTHGFYGVRRSSIETSPQQMENFLGKDENQTLLKEEMKEETFPTQQF